MSIQDGKIVWMDEEQQEIDRIVKARLDREKAKYNDYDTLKTQVDELSTYKAQAEYNLQVKVKEALEQKEQQLKADYETQINTMKAEQIRESFLSSADIKLPSAYKQMIKASADIEEVKKSYNEVVNSWKEEMKALGLNKSDKDIGAPGNPGGQSTTKKFSEMTYAEKEELFKKDKDLYLKLRDAK